MQFFYLCIKQCSAFIKQKQFFYQAKAVYIYIYIFSNIRVWMQKQFGTLFMPCLVKFQLNFQLNILAVWSTLEHLNWIYILCKQNYYRDAILTNTLNLIKLYSNKVIFLVKSNKILIVATLSR